MILIANIGKNLKKLKNHIGIIIKSLKLIKKNQISYHNLINWNQDSQ
jgi:hypothetical protein